jgi:hypothetical protein
MQPAPATNIIVAKNIFKLISLALSLRQLVSIAISVSLVHFVSDETAADAANGASDKRSSRAIRNRAADYCS